MLKSWQTGLALIRSLSGPIFGQITSADILREALVSSKGISVEPLPLSQLLGLACKSEPLKILVQECHPKSQFLAKAYAGGDMDRE